MNCIKTVYRCIKTKVIPLKTMNRYFVISTIFEILQKLEKNVKLLNDEVLHHFLFVPEMAGSGGRKKAAEGDAKKGQSSSSSRGKPLKTLWEIKEER